LPATIAARRTHLSSRRLRRACCRSGYTKSAFFVPPCE
jgi:hypothetical protein